MRRNLKPDQVDQNEPLFSSSDGNLLVGIARESISTFLNSKKVVIPYAAAGDSRFDQRLGCFVTLRHDDKEKSLRGCIGFPEPLYKLSKALPESAVSAAVADPRFPPVKVTDLDLLLLEVSLLTKPTQITSRDKKELIQQIKIGRDGLIMKWSFGSGLLLPQVASEYSWNAEEFLCNLSMKAGAPPDEWLIPGTLIYKFQAQVFEETSPNGSVVMSRD